MVRFLSDTKSTTTNLPGEDQKEISASETVRTRKIATTGTFSQKSPGAVRRRLGFEDAEIGLMWRFAGLLRSQQRIP